jgi:hypothetical protein
MQAPPVVHTVIKTNQAPVSGGGNAGNAGGPGLLGVPMQGAGSTANPTAPRN